MREKLFAMMRLLVDQAMEGSHILQDEREISNFLASRGFQQEDIYDALSWLQQLPLDRREGGDAFTQSRRGRAVRVLHPEEHLAFSPAAQGIVHRLYNAGAIDDWLREELIQRCIDLSEEEIGLAEVRTVALLVLLRERRDALRPGVLQMLRDDNVRLPD